MHSLRLYLYWLACFNVLLGQGHTKMGYNSLKKVFLTTKKEITVEQLQDDAKFEI